ncbi:hypothetical protein Tcan_15419 [Toxocara canis]|uniref:Uncharacterized protein n=1 Tax=Toxocara canis TaxID=6265 RepID=A0A0B2VMV5_TOXCA|nr:hypothetical protein Tcan_15419 [Toxocara canis]
MPVQANNEADKSGLVVNWWWISYVAERVRPVVHTVRNQEHKGSSWIPSAIVQCVKSYRELYRGHKPEIDSQPGFWDQRQGQSPKPYHSLLAIFLRYTSMSGEAEAEMYERVLSPNPSIV